jgi:RimJ/RimL family protein N-acetyltransferase
LSCRDHRHVGGSGAGDEMRRSRYGGHHRITIDPATENIAAIRAYEKAGFKPVGVMRQHERDAGGGGWHDSLLMELLASED